MPVYVHRSVPDLDEAALMIITSKSFDNGTACVAEQTRGPRRGRSPGRALAAFADAGR